MLVGQLHVWGGLKWKVLYYRKGVSFLFQLWALGQLLPPAHQNGGPYRGAGHCFIISSLGLIFACIDKNAFPVIAISDCHRPSKSHIMWSLILATEGGSWFSVRSAREPLWEDSEGWLSRASHLSVLCSLEQGLALPPDVTVLMPCADLSPPPLLGFFLLPGHRMTTEGAGDSYLHLSYFGQWQNCECFSRLAISQNL